MLQEPIPLRRVCFVDTATVKVLQFLVALSGFCNIISASLTLGIFKINSRSLELKAVGKEAGCVEAIESIV